MDRLPSQSGDNVRPSGIKPPQGSRLPAIVSSVPGRTLLETSQSDLNARIAMPPPNGPIKHKISGLPEPQAKQRKTLAERAGEPLNAPRSHVGHLAKSAIVTSSHLRSSSALPSVSRKASNASNGETSITGFRPPSRPNGQRNTFGGRTPSAPEHSGQIEEGDDEDVGVVGNRKGTPILSFFSTDNKITLRKTLATGNLRGSQSLPGQASAQHARFPSRRNSSITDDGDGGKQRYDSWDATTHHPSRQQASSSRDVSLCTSFAGLSLHPTRTRSNTQDVPRKASGPKLSTRHTPSLDRIKEQISPSKIPKFSCSPSLSLPLPHAKNISNTSPLKSKASLNGLRTPVSNAKLRREKRDELTVFLTKEKLTSTPAWDTKGRLEDMERTYGRLQTEFAAAADSKSALEESLNLYKSRVQELVETNSELGSANRKFSADLERARADLHTTTMDLYQARRDHEREIQDAERKHERNLNDLHAKQESESRRLTRDLEKISEQSKREMEDAKRAWQKLQDDETSEMTTQHWEETDELRRSHRHETEKLQRELDELKRSGESRATESAGEVQSLRDATEDLRNQIDAAKSTESTLRAQVAEADRRSAALEHERANLNSKMHFLEGNQEAQSLEFTTMSKNLQDAIDQRDATLATLRKEEVLRRKLNATILELRGNIRVFARLRPLLAGEDDAAKVEYPDAESLDGAKEMVVHAPTTLSATGKQRNEKHSYAFDRVFCPGTANLQVFEECRDLIQSVVDGYNVSILSYGQTGSGKTFGMSGPDGIIPSSISLLLAEIQRLRGKGWEYIVESNFVEVYNETLNDLLGDAKSWDEGEDPNASVRGKKKEKHEIHHDAATGKTTVTNLSCVRLWPPPAASPRGSVDGEDLHAENTYTTDAATALLETAAKNRRVAATKSNERSSRSHSIFVLTLRGSCAATDERSEGVLNLVDLAGSERLKQSGAEGNRMKETQAINKSLSSLGDVIAALGSKKGDESHVPYRNSKLTYLLQSSLGGTHAGTGKSSRTLMLLHLSPLQCHWQESRGSLLFGSKVHGTHIGAGKKK